MKRDELAVLTALSGDSVVTRGEAAGYGMKISICAKNLKCVLALCEGRPANRKRPIQAQRKRPPGKQETKPTLFNRAIRLPPSRGSFINRQRTGKRFDASKQSVRDPKKLTVGQTLVIP